MGNSEPQATRTGSGKEIAMLVGVLLLVAAGTVVTYWIRSQGAEAANQAAAPAPAQTPAPRPRTVAPVPTGTEVVHADVYFDFKSTRLSAAAVRLLQEKAALLEHASTWGVLVQGYADRQGPAEYNRTLAQRRATSVKQFLVELGVPEASIKVVAIGPEGSLCDEPSHGVPAAQPSGAPGDPQAHPRCRRAGTSEAGRRRHARHAGGREAGSVTFGRLTFVLVLLVLGAMPARADARRFTEGTLLWRRPSRRRPCRRRCSPPTSTSGHRHGRAGGGAPALHEPEHRLGGGRLRLPAARGRRRRPPAACDRRPHHRRRRSRSGRGQGDLRAGQGSRASAPAWSSRSAPTSSRPRSPTSARATTIEIEIEYQQAVPTTTAASAALPDGGGAALHPGRADRGDGRHRLGTRHRRGARRLAHHAAGRASRSAGPLNPGSRCASSSTPAAAGRRGAPRTQIHTSR